MNLPERSQVVIIGGGVVGCSIAYHLAQRGLVDVVLLERKTLTSGSTWHAAGLVGQLRSSSNLTKLMQKSVETYQQLEKKTGYATGWRGVGSVRVASSPDRWEELKRVATTGKSFGFEVELISAQEAKDLFPLLNTDGIYGATWVSSDGYVDPSQLTLSFTTGARDAGVKIIQNCRVETIERTGRRVSAVITEHGRIECDVVVNATGMWGAETAKLAAVDLAVSAVEHQYVVTEKSEAIPADLPTFRDPDARFYLKPDAGALIVGGWEDGTRSPWHRIPIDLGDVLFPPNHERFQLIAEQAANRIPIFGDLGIQSWINGPIPFSPDAEPLMGITEDLDNLYHCCGFSAGIAAAGGAGYAMANWILDGDPGMDLWPFDVRRFGKFHNVPAYLEQRSIDAYSHYYQIAYPNRELAAPRKQRLSALYGVLESRGAVFGTKFGWERANWFVTDGSLPVETASFGRSNAFSAIAAEHHAVRNEVGIVDQSSFSKYEISGPGALDLLQKVAGADINAPVGKIVYTQLLNVRGGIEADVTITRLSADLFYLVTGSAFGRHDLAFILQNAPDDGSVTVREVTSSYGVLNLCGPRAREVAAKLSSSDLSNDAFPYMTAQNIDLGFAPALALRATYVGELGWEFHIPTEFMRSAYENIMSVGEEFGIRNIGYRAIESLRLEKQYVAWASDIRSDNNPFEAGLGFTAISGKPGQLAGPALAKIRENGVTQKLCWFTADPEVVMHGDELLTHEHEALATTVKSAGYGHTVGRTIFSAYLPIALARETDFVVDVATKRFPAVRHDQPLYDPKGVRIRA
jgi:glycine cleavage system aminomethyltransferase T/glycine/D-amino acid oxidase-like deaminating enzyme